MTIEERLEKLEKRNRYLSLTLGIGVVGFAMLGFTAQAKEEVPEVVRARQFVVMDSMGKRRAILGMDEDGPLLGLYDKNESNRVTLTISKVGPFLVLKDEEGTPRATLMLATDGPKLGLIDGAGKSRAMLRVTESSPTLVLRDEKERPRIALGTLKDGPWLDLYDDAENVRAGIYVDKEKGPSLNLYDNAANGRARLGLTKHGPVLSLYDEKATQRVWLATIDTGKDYHEVSGLVLLDEKQIKRVGLSVVEGVSGLQLYDEKGTVIRSFTPTP